MNDSEEGVGLAYISRDMLAFNPHDMHFVHDVPFDRFGASHERVLRRALVFTGAGLLVYVIGLAIATWQGFNDLYVSSPGVYVILITASFMLGRVHWGVREYIVRLRRSREAFIVPSAQYRTSVTNVMDVATAKRPVYFLVLVASAIVTSIIAASYFFGEQAWAAHFNILRPSTLPIGWFVGSHLVSKFITLDIMVCFALCVFCDCVYMTAMAFLSWTQLVSPWSVLPVPSYVQVRLTPLGQMLFHGAFYYAVGVLAVVVLYGGTFSIPVVVVVGAFALIGVVLILVPLLSIGRMVTRAQDQIATTVAIEYYARLFPVARSADLIGAKATAQNDDTFVNLRNLEELMNSAKQADSGLLRLNVLVPVILRQAIPFLGFLYPVITRH
jgi:hypothetical protein